MGNCNGAVRIKTAAFTHPFTDEIESFKEKLQLEPIQSEVGGVGDVGGVGGGGGVVHTTRCTAPQSGSL